MIKYEKIFEEWDLLPELQSLIMQYIELYDCLKFQTLSKDYYNKYKAKNHERTEKFIRYIKLMNGRSFNSNDIFRSFIHLLKSNRI